MKLNLNVPAIKCEGCSETVQETLDGIAGVSEVRVDVAGKRVELALDLDQTSEADVRTRLADAGFPAS